MRNAVTLEDLHELGMIAGRSPFAAPAASDAIAAIIHNEPAPLTRFEPEAPADVDNPTEGAPWARLTRTRPLSGEGGAEPINDSNLRPPGS